MKPNDSAPTIVETEVTLVSENTRIQGVFEIDQVTRVHGKIEGEVRGTTGSSLIIAETGWVRGKIEVDSLWIDGLVEGEIHARERVHVSVTGRVLGDVVCPKVVIDFGAHFDGNCRSS